MKQENLNCNACHGIFSSSTVKHTRYKIIKCNVHSDFNKKWLDSSNKRHSSGGTSLVPGSHLIYIWGRPCGMCGGHSGTAAGLCRPLRFFLANSHATNVLAVIYHQGLVKLNRVWGRSHKTLSLALPPTAQKLNEAVFIQNLTVTHLVKRFSASRNKQKFQDNVHKSLPYNHIPSQFNEQTPSHPIYLTNDTF
jgi:hypothetical protein